MNAEANGIGMSGGPAVTSGNIADYIGFSRRSWLIYAGALLVAAALGASSFWIEDSRNGIAQPLWCYGVTELTSVAMLFALTPMLLHVTKRLDPQRLGWPRTVIGHLAAFAVGSTAHISGMVTLRMVIYPLFGRQYTFSTPGNLGLQIIYEVRKDAAIYLGMVALLWLIARTQRRLTTVIVQPATASTPARMEIRDGAKRVFLDPAEILWAEAAGNYVELHLANGSHLQRQTLSALETQLAGQEFLRIHRSRLVNRRHVKSISSNDSGDFTITLSDGRTISGGRRWRDALKL